LLNVGPQWGVARRQTCFYRTVAMAVAEGAEKASHSILLHRFSVRADIRPQSATSTSGMAMPLRDQARDLGWVRLFPPDPADAGRTNYPTDAPIAATLQKESSNFLSLTAPRQVGRNHRREEDPDHRHSAEVVPTTGTSPPSLRRPRPTESSLTTAPRPRQTIDLYYPTATSTTGKETGRRYLMRATDPRRGKPAQ